MKLEERIEDLREELEEAREYTRWQKETYEVEVDDSLVNRLADALEDAERDGDDQQREIESLSAMCDDKDERSKRYAKERDTLRAEVERLKGENLALRNVIGQSDPNWLQNETGWAEEVGNFDEEQRAEAIAKIKTRQGSSR